MFDISHELKLRLIDESNMQINHHVEQLDMTFEGKSYKVPAKSWIEIVIDFKDTPDLFLECELWYSTIMTYFKTSYTACKIDIGQFEGLWPTSFDFENMTVNFLADYVRPGRKDWRDWFCKGAIHASE
jgi:hypothetical protein